MRFELRRKVEPDFELIGLAVAALVLPVTFVWLVSFGGSLPRNELHDLLTLPCALCGGTRSLMYLISGDIVSAMSMNPLVATGTIAVLVWCIYSFVVLVFFQWRLRLVFESLLEVRLVAGGALSLLIANWGYVWTIGV